jgi:hypothetical protein
VNFEFNLSLPADRRYAPMLRDLAAHGARQAGMNDAEAIAFGRRVEAAAGDALTVSGSAASVPVTVRCSGGPVEMTIGSCCVSTTH